MTHCNALQRTATRCNALQRTATHCSTLQRTATLCNTLQRTATLCNTLQRTATLCNTLQRTATLCNTLQRTATHCNTLQRTATHCSTLQRTATHFMSFFASKLYTYGVAMISRLLKMKVSFAEYSLFYRALLQKRHIILRSLLLEATQYAFPLYLHTHPGPLFYSPSLSVSLRFSAL